MSCLLSAAYSGELPRQNKHKGTTTNAEISQARTKRHIRNKVLHLIYCKLKVKSGEEKNIHYKKHIVTHTTITTTITTATTSTITATTSTIATAATTTAATAATTTTTTNNNNKFNLK